LYDKRQTQSETTLRQEDYNAILRLDQNLYTGGAVTSQLAIAQLNIDKANYELQEIVSRVTMDVRIAFDELLLNRAKVRVREDSVRVLEEELKSQQESLNVGIVGKLNVQRAEVALANERPELFNAQTELKNSYLRLAELFGTDVHPGAQTPPFEISGELQYGPNHPDVNNCLARADANRPVIKARQKDIEIEDRQYVLDRSATRPHVRAFSGYEVYSERDPAVGPEFNYGGVVGINATWDIFDGYATKGRMQATRARQRWKLWQQRGGVSPQKCAVHFSIFSKPSAYSKTRQKTCRRRTKRWRWPRAISLPDWEHSSMCCKRHLM
jgi:outer membrane protein